ncbi:helix-turn-helix domain-containing protein [Thomasclavelia spiroformis]|uniref:helix-turn-helix domain-containing protein n=1 Tax=Thomasclavelia spiroformis TaxID=29348 RepID=UPI0039A05AC9
MLQQIFKLLIDKGIRKMEFARMAGISQNTMARLSRNQDVSLDVLGKICCTLNCKVDDILEFMPEEKTNY